MDARKTKLAPSRGAMVGPKPALAALLVGSLLTATAQAKDCVPSCRDGYVCYEGESIVACNPPCAEAEVCVGEGQCVAAASSAPASPTTFVGLGGFLMIAGGVVFATGEWSGY